MSIDYDKRGLRLGYLLRGALTDADGNAQTVRLCGPASRAGTGYVGPDPDDGAKDPRNRYWRATQAVVDLVDDVGKLSQHVGVLAQLSVSLPLSYPADPRLETVDPTGDYALRAWAVEGRWANHPVSVWLVDLDTGDTEHRFNGTWARGSTVRAGSLALSAREAVGPLGKPWLVGTVPPSTDDWIGGGAGNVNANNLYLGPPDPAFFGLADDTKGKHIGAVFGHDPNAAGSTSPGRVWQQVVYYGRSVGFGVGTSVGDPNKPVAWFWVAPNFGCSVATIRIVDASGAVQQAGSGNIAITGLVGHNHDAWRGPIGTFLAIQTDGGGVFDYAGDQIIAWARVSGPPLAGATSLEWSALYGEPFTGGFGARTDTTRSAADLIELLISDAEYLGEPTLLGSSAIGDFITRSPAGAVATYSEQAAAVPTLLGTEIPTYREVLHDLVAGLPADLLRRVDPTNGERRLYPWWRRPTLGEAPDYVIGPDSLASLAPAPSIQQIDDPNNEYATDSHTLVPEFVLQSESAWGDVSDLESMSSYAERIQDPAEVVLNAGVNPYGESKWQWWTPATASGAADAARFLAAESSQPQTWVEAILGGRWLRLQLGDTIGYEIHGITRRVGMVRRLDFDLDAQAVTVTTCHVLHYADAGN